MALTEEQYKEYYPKTYKKAMKEEWGGKVQATPSRKTDIYDLARAGQTYQESSRQTFEQYWEQYKRERGLAAYGESALSEGRAYYEVPVTASTGDAAKIGMTEKVYAQYQEALREQDEQKRAEMMAKLPTIPTGEIRPGHRIAPGETADIGGRIFPTTRQELFPTFFKMFTTTEEHEKRAREEIRQAPPETLTEVMFAPPKSSMFYEEKFGLAAPIVEFTSASMPTFTSVFDPRSWFSGEQTDLSGVGFGYEMTKAGEFAIAEPIKVSGYAAGFGMGMFTFGKVAGKIGRKVTKVPPEYQVKYWKGTMKMEMGERPIGYDFLIEKPGKLDVGFRTLDMKTVKAMTKYEKISDFKLFETDTFRLTTGKNVKSIFKTKTVKEKPIIPELVDVLEVGKPTMFKAGVGDDILIGKEFVSARIPIKTAADDPFKVKIFRGKGRKGDVLREMFPYKGGKDVMSDFFKDLSLKERFDFGKPGKPLLDTAFKPRAKTVRTWEVPYEFEEIGYPAAYPPAMMPKIPGLGETKLDIKTTFATGKQLMGIDVKPMIKFEERAFTFKPLFKAKEPVLSFKPPKVGSRQKPILDFKPIVAERQLQPMRERQIFKQDQPFRFDFKPIDIFKRGWGKPGPGIGFPGTVIPVGGIPPMPNPFRRKRKRRGKKKKGIIRKYRYTSTLGGRLFRKPILKAPKGILTGLKMRPLIISRKKKVKKRRK